jgi:alpha-tubulin suppressor-like RCC1 family protein
MQAMAVGGNHACGLTAAGGLRCWGSNQSGQLGDGTSVDSSVPVTVSGLGSGVAAVAAGYYFTCAVTTGGAAKCWGSNNTGQLGVAGIGAANTPVNVTGLATGASAVGAGDGHGCARTTAGGVSAGVTTTRVRSATARLSSARRRST